jgi:hypothetical protein
VPPPRATSEFGGAKELKWDELKVGGVVGKGSFGEVRKRNVGVESRCVRGSEDGEVGSRLRSATPVCSPV